MTTHRFICPFVLVIGCSKPVELPPPIALEANRTGVSVPERIPPLDDRAYRIVELDNGFTAMLVSDPDATESAAALSVDVGSLDEPDDRGGLAHFLEHMLFMGTDVYPDVDGFMNHIDAHAGASNAWTADEMTQYHFTIDAAAFDEALHRFSRFFVRPLLSKRYVKKETKAVESEYRMNMEGRMTRWFEARRETVNPEHPGSRFSWGSKETLADRPGDSVMDDLQVFYDAHYTADRMKLAMLHSESLDTLEGWVRDRFEDVPTGQAAAPAEAKPQFRDDQLGVRIDIKQREDVHGLVLEWPIPEQHDSWPDAPTELLAHVLGDEGPGSLFAQLVERNWVTELYAGAMGDIGPGGDLFQIDMTLTSKGAAHTDDIIAACFAAIDMLKNTPMPDHLTQEILALQEIDFQFEPPTDAGVLTEWVAEMMVDYPAQRVLDAGLTQPVDDSALLGALLEQMSIDNVRIIVDGQDVQTDRVEPMFNVEYGIRPLTEAERSTFAGGSAIAVRMPPPNQWIPQSTEVRTQETADFARKVADEATVWVAPDARWETPRAITQIDVRMSTEGIESLDDQVMARFYNALLNQHLTDFRYPVELASSEFFLHIRPARLRLFVDAWTDVHAPLVKAILDELVAFGLTEENFEDKKTELIREWGNMAHAGPVELAIHMPRSAIYTHSRSYVQYLEKLKLIEFSDLQKYVDGYFLPGLIRTLSYGDTDDAMARMERDYALDALGIEQTDAVHDFTQVQWYPKGVSRTHEVTAEHDDSAVVMTYMGEPGIASAARWQLLAELLGQPFFNDLRTQQQLGYWVSLWASQSLRVPGIELVVQSSVKGPSVLIDRVDAFLGDSPTLLTKMDPAAFATARDALVASYREPTSTFDEQWSRIRGPVTWGDDDGVYGDRLADAIEGVSQDEVVQLARELFATDSPTRIVSWAVGRAHPKDPIKGTADCADRACLAEGMEPVFTKDFAHPTRDVRR